MKKSSIGGYLESLFANSHCDSQFAYFCLFMLLAFLFYTFAEGVLEELNTREDDLIRKETAQRNKLLAPAAIVPQGGQQFPG